MKNTMDKKVNIGRIGAERALELRERQAGPMSDRRLKRQKTRSGQLRAALDESYNED